MPCRKEIREQVLEAILEVMLAAHREGRDESAAVSAAFPDVPDPVIWDAYSTFYTRIEDEFWTSIEKTIDGEIISRALVGSASPPPDQIDDQVPW